MDKGLLGKHDIKRDLGAQLEGSIKFTFHCCVILPSITSYSTALYWDTLYSYCSSRCIFYCIVCIVCMFSVFLLLFTLYVLYETHHTECRKYEWWHFWTGGQTFAASQICSHLCPQIGETYKIHNSQSPKYKIYPQIVNITLTQLTSMRTYVLK